MVSRTLNMVIPLFLNLSTLNSTYWPLLFNIGEKNCFTPLPPVSTLSPSPFLSLFFFFLASPAARAREQTYVHSSNRSCSGDNARSLTHWARGTPEILILSSFVLPNKTSSSSSLKTRNTFYVPDSSLSTLYIWAPFIFKINAWDINYFHSHFW